MLHFPNTFLKLEKSFADNILQLPTTIILYILCTIVIKNLIQGK